ncbi:hypothetical protein [uncultured Cocleimonas sp.]|uniref:hypothetical protein n=1 Tax=uncultured Cocleimonas sp. TaxID=1051587 RepID=UPI002615A9A5|nr:hypothetical protein [uncultured Cocleimonas sp.]
MNTKVIIAGTLLTALFAGQSALAGQDTDETVYAELTANTTVTQSASTDKVNYDVPSVTNEVFVSGRK